MKKNHLMNYLSIVATVLAAGHVQAADRVITEFVEANSWHCHQAAPDQASLNAALKVDSRLKATPSNPQVYRLVNSTVAIMVMAHRQGCVTIAELNSVEPKPSLNDVIKALSTKGYQKHSQNVSYKEKDGIKALVSETVLKRKRKGNDAVLVYPMDDNGPQRLSLVTANYRQQSPAKTPPVAADNDNVTLHRKQAGNKVNNGWYPAQSTKGDYSVLMPLKFNDFSVKSQDDKVRSVEMLNTRSHEGIRFLASRTFYSEPGQAAVVFDKFTSGEIVPETSRKTLNYKGYEAVLIETSGQNTANSQLVMKVGETLMLMAIEWPHQHGKTAKKLGDIFFKSFNAG